MRLGPQFDAHKFDEHINKYRFGPFDDDALPKFEVGQLPAVGTKLYRGVKRPTDGTNFTSVGRDGAEIILGNMGEVGSVQNEGVVGISWSEAPWQAGDFARQGVGEAFVIETEVDDPQNQIIPRRAIRHTIGNDERNADRLASQEREYNPRPGASLRVTNRDELLQLGINVPERLTVEHRGKMKYSNLEDFRVKGN